MKIICVFLYISLILFSVFACTIPSELEITGSPSIKFAVNKDFSDFYKNMFNDILSTDDNEIQILKCTNPSLKYRTFLSYMKVFDDDYQVKLEGFDDSESVNIGDNGHIVINGIEIPLSIDDIDNTGDVLKFKKLDKDYPISSSKEPITASFSSLKNYLSGFGFATVQLKLFMYMDDSPLLNCLEVEIFDESGDSPRKLENTQITNGTSGLDGHDVYGGDKIPGGESNVNEIKDIINNNGDLSFGYNIYIPKDTEIESGWVTGTHKISIEVVIWLPLEFVPLEDDAQFVFPEFFDGIGDLFKSLAGNEFINEMKIEIGLHPQNPFGSGKFIIRNGEHDIICPMDKNSFSFELDKENLDYINENIDSFNPIFLIQYPDKNTELGIPNEDVMITTVSLNAKLKYKMEL
jgi:hypothetical protein